MQKIYTFSLFAGLMLVLCTLNSIVGAGIALESNTKTGQTQFVVVLNPLLTHLDI